LKDSRVNSSVLAEAVTTATLNLASFHILCCLMNREVEYLRDTSAQIDDLFFLVQ